MDHYTIIKNIISSLKIKISTRLKESEYLIVKNYIIATLEIFYRDINITNINQIIEDIFTCENYYIYNPPLTYFIPKFIRIEDKDMYYDVLIENSKRISCSIKDSRAINWYLHLKNLPQPVQRSQEWYDTRNNMITASVGAAIIKESPYQKMNDVLLDKLGKGEPYKENKYVHHGKKYEKIATMIYENLFNTKVGEFGLIPYQSRADKVIYSFLGASPDGINSPYTLDGKLNKKLNTMLEIKCPASRKIKTSGKIDGVICPHYYWIQIQLQLACCDLEECDFWQCNISDCTYDEILQIDKNCDTIITEEQNILIENYNKNITRGCILQFLPKTRVHSENDKIEWYAKYIYPVDVVMTTEEYNNWANMIIKNYTTLYPDLVKDYYFDRIIYWKLNNAHNVNIKRNLEWFNEKISLFEDFWDKVLYYRNNNDSELIDSLMNKQITKTKSKKQQYLDNLSSDMFLTSEEKII